MSKYQKVLWTAFALWVLANAVSAVLSLRQYDPWRAITTEVREDQ